MPAASPIPINHHVLRSAISPFHPELTVAECPHCGYRLVEDSNIEDGDPVGPDE
jgi:hypothetical protein